VAQALWLSNVDLSHSSVEGDLHSSNSQGFLCVRGDRSFAVPMPLAVDKGRVPREGGKFKPTERQSMNAGEGLCLSCSWVVGRTRESHKEESSSQRRGRVRMQGRACVPHTLGSLGGQESLIRLIQFSPVGTY